MAQHNKPSTEVPKDVQAQVLQSSRRRCCICWYLQGNAQQQKGQIAHLDRKKPPNHAFDNLAYLCMPHHDDYDGKTSQSKGFTETEVKGYREKLYTAVERNEIPTEPIPAPPIVNSSSPSIQTTFGAHSPVLNIAGDLNYNKRVVRKNIVQPGPEHVSPQQALEIRTRVVELAELEAQSGRKAYPGKWYNKLYDAFGVTSYLLIPATRFDEVISWLQQQGALLRPKLRRTNNLEWRKSLYKGLWARAHEIGMSKPDVYAFAQRVLELSEPLESLTGLGERQLDYLYKALFRQGRD